MRKDKVFLSKDDLFEIEKVLDIYAGQISSRLVKIVEVQGFIISNLAKIEEKNSLADHFSLVPEFLEFQRTRDMIRSIRDKLERMRSER